MYSINAVHLIAVDHSCSISIIIAVIYVNFVGAPTFVGIDSSMYSSDAVHLVAVDHSCGLTGVATRTSKATTITIIIAVIYVNFVGTSSFVGGDSWMCSIDAGH